MAKSLGQLFSLVTKTQLSRQCARILFRTTVKRTMMLRQQVQEGNSGIPKPERMDNPVSSGSALGSPTSCETSRRRLPGGRPRPTLLSAAKQPQCMLKRAVPSILSPKPRDFSLPNSSWGEEMMQLYNYYNDQSGVGTEGEEEQGGQWMRLPSYNRSLKYAIGGVYLSKIIQSKARLFTRNIKQVGAAFEYVVFYNKDKQTCVCVLQAGHLLEGPPGHVHGGAIATMIDTVTGTHASLLCAPVMTANLNINYRSPIPLGSTVLIESTVGEQEGKKTLVSCKITSTDGSKLHTEATALFVSISVGHLLRG